MECNHVIAVLRAFEKARATLRAVFNDPEIEKIGAGCRRGHSAARMSAVLLLLLVGTGSAHGRTSAVSVPDGCGSLIYSFDPSKLIEARFRKLLLLSDTPANEWMAISLNNCSELDPRYKPCGSYSPESLHFFANAEVNISDARAQFAKYKAVEAPSVLKPAYDYRMAEVSFYLWTLETKLDYLKTGDLSVLRKPWRSLDPVASCGPALERLAAAKTQSARFDELRYGWYNCMNRLLRREFVYPQKSWDRFLKEYKVTVEGPEGEDCD